MNWVQSALNGCVPILRVLGFPDMCLYPTRHTRTSGSPFPLGSTKAPDLSSPCQNTEAYPATCSQSTCFSKETSAERGSTCPFLPLLDVSRSLVPNSFVTLCGVNMKWPIGSWVEGLVPLWWLFWKVAESLGGTRPKGWGFLWSVPCPWLFPPSTSWPQLGGLSCSAHVPIFLLSLSAGQQTMNSYLWAQAYFFYHVFFPWVFVMNTALHTCLCGLS